MFEKEQMLLFKTDDDKCSALLSVKTQNSSRIQFEVLKLWGPWEQFDPEIQKGSRIWKDINEVNILMLDKVLSNPTQEMINEWSVEQVKSRMQEPAVTNTKPPENIENSTKKQEKIVNTTIFTPFKFKHTLETISCLKKLGARYDIGRIVSITTAINEKLEPVSTYTIETFGITATIKIEAKEFDKLNPVFFDDFEYNPPEEKIDEQPGRDNPVAVS